MLLYVARQSSKNKCSNRHIRYWRFVLASNSQPGVRVPLGVHKQFAGGMQYFKSYQDKPTKGKQKRFWGYTKRINFDLGVHKEIQYWFGGTGVTKGWEPLV
jgi:hypothetical protein